jgi:hypothetical protein
LSKSPVLVAVLTYSYLRDSIFPRQKRN